jgi:protein TonB
LLGVGSLLGLILATAALMGRSPHAGRDVAWAALSANALALFTLLPLAAGYWAYRQSPMSSASDDDSLPQPVQDPFESLKPGPPVLAPPPPPPPQPERPPLSKDSAAPVAPSVPPMPAAPGAPSEPPATPVRVAGGIQEPRKTRNVSPVYPREAKEARVQGVVILECTISPEGKVVEVKVLRGVPLLDEAAVTAVRQWEYTPTLLDGVPVPVIMTVTVNFRLS